MSQFADAIDDSSLDDEFILRMQDKVFGSVPSALPVPVSPASLRPPATVADTVADEEEEEEEDYNYEYEDDEMDTLHSSLTNERSYVASKSPNIKASNLNTSHRSGNQVSKMERKEETGSTRHQGRDDRATSEQVLDPR